MLRFPLLVACAAVLAPACAAQTTVEATDIVNHPFSVEFPSGGALRLRVRSGDIHVIGVDQDRISVEVSGRKAWDAGKLKVRVERKGSAGEMRISGGPHNDLTITIRIPSKTDLHVRVPAGDVRVENIAGNKDVELHAGDLTVALGDSEDYSHVDASVLAGGVDAPYSTSRAAACSARFRGSETAGTACTPTSERDNSRWSSGAVR